MSESPNAVANAFLTRLQWGIVKAQAHRLPGLVLRWVCRSGTWWVGRRLRSMTGVEAVYVRHTHPRSPSFVPGHSDLDLTIVMDDGVDQSPGAAESVARFIEQRRLFYYYLSPVDARIITASELANMTTRWPPVEILVGPEDWTLIAGRELRHRVSATAQPEQLALHPEFNRWWQHILQDYLLCKLPGEESRYHRVLYRGAIKQLAHLMLARGRAPARKPSFSDEDLTRWVLDRHPALKSLLEPLRENEFWERKEGGSREAIFHEVLRKTTEFFSESGGESGGEGAGKAQVVEFGSRPEDHGSHSQAYLVLAKKLDEMPRLTSLLQGVLVYPTPHCLPWFYQAELLLPDGISLAELRLVTGYIRESLGGRGLGSDGYHFGITLMPASASRSARVYRGSPFPFLPEHVAEHGCLISGTSHAMVMPDSEALADWCRIFFPYFRSNLTRRIEHASRTLNFCHLAAVRLFLETGEIITDPTELTRRHRAVFDADSPSSETWEYLLRDKPGKADRTRYRAARSHLQLELDRVERLLWPACSGSRI